MKAATVKALVLLCMTAGISSAGITLSATGGLSHQEPLTFAYTISLYYKLDEQVLLGVSSGQQQKGVPVLGSLYMRLPLGRIILPVITGHIGCFIHDNDSGMLWKLGGGIDWKNGERSSILILGGYEKNGSPGNVYSRLGLLLEF